VLTGACAPRQEGADKILFKKCDAYEGKNLLEMESKGLTQFPMIFVAIDGQGMGSMCVSAFAGGRTRVHVARGAPRACRRERRGKTRAGVCTHSCVRVCPGVAEKYVREETPTPEKFTDYLITKLEPTSDEDVFPYRLANAKAAHVSSMRFALCVQSQDMCVQCVHCVHALCLLTATS